ncbi:MAG: hypothetical protein CM15mP79_1140 [Methanobacteriota archaeon]|nr:MAG: hypothetical protein CM15mP79_1140 [Euryarchaeota archaeon]
MRWWKRAEVSEDLEEEDPLAGLSHTDAEQFAAARLDAVGPPAHCSMAQRSTPEGWRSRKPRRHQNTTSVVKPMHACDDLLEPSIVVSELNVVVHEDACRP